MRLCSGSASTTPGEAAAVAAVAAPASPAVLVADEASAPASMAAASFSSASGAVIDRSTPSHVFYADDEVDDCDDYYHGYDHVDDGDEENENEDDDADADDSLWPLSTKPD